jgi:amphi-Trp domain-containing protein
VIPRQNQRMANRDLQKTYTRSQFAAKLRRFADAIETAKPFTIQVAGERLRVPGEVEFHIEHERSGKNEVGIPGHLEIKLGGPVLVATSLMRYTRFSSNLINSPLREIAILTVLPSGPTIMLSNLRNDVEVTP